MAARHLPRVDQATLAIFSLQVGLNQLGYDVQDELCFVLGPSNTKD